MNSYNGYSPEQRNKKLRALRKLKAAGNDPTPLLGTPCAICGQTGEQLVLHSESYSQPFSFHPPDCFGICQSAHWYLHHRDNAPELWAALKMHVIRGGHCGEIKFLLDLYKMLLGKDPLSLGPLPGRQMNDFMFRQWWQALK